MVRSRSPLPRKRPAKCLGHLAPVRDNADRHLPIGKIADPEAILATARQQLASFKIPKKILFRDELPRNAMGKVQKVALRADLSDLFV